MHIVNAYPRHSRTAGMGYARPMTPADYHHLRSASRPSQDTSAPSLFSLKNLGLFALGTAAVAGIAALAFQPEWLQKLGSWTSDAISSPAETLGNLVKAPGAMLSDMVGKLNPFQAVS